MTNIAGSDHMANLMGVLGRLDAGASLAVKSEVASKVCDEMNAGIFGPGETRIAAEILEILSYGMEGDLRKIISAKLCRHPALPHDLAVRLAGDVLEVALPVLEFSFVLSDDDLSEIIKSTTEVAKQQAIAKRKPLSYRLVDELINRREKSVVKTVLGNSEAYISSRSAEKIIADFKSSDDVLQALVDRGNLPLELVERMVTMVSGKIRRQLVEEYRISADIAADLSEDAHDEMVLSHAQRKKIEEINNLVRHLHENRKLNFTLILRALCKGDLEFFTSGISCIANIPKSNVHKLIHDKSFMGFQALYKAANLPENLYEATKILLRFAIAEEENPGSGEDYAARMVKNVTAAGYDDTVTNMKYLLALINGTTGEGRGGNATLH